MTSPRQILILPVCICFFGLAVQAEDAKVSIEKADETLTVKLGDELFFVYRFTGGQKPYAWPVMGPTGDRITRAYPMEVLDTEKHDHHHQKSHWFTHGDVNGIDFWSETDKSGIQQHAEFLKIEGGDVGVIRQRVNWLSPDKKKVCEDIREYRIHSTTSPRIIDMAIELKATEGPVTLGDTKEGSFGFRLATTMRSDRGGLITNSEGATNEKAWGKPAAWVDYSGPVKGNTVGVTIMDHPASFRHPTHWHVRTYGLFAANPFGLHDFYRDKSKDGSHQMKKGDVIRFRYRVVFHEGDVQAAKVAERYKEFAAQK